MTIDPAVTVEEIVDRIDAWRGRPVSIRPLTNGLTNSNYRVDVDGQAFVVRIPGASTDLLVHRPRERAPQRPRGGRARHRSRGAPPLPGQRRDGDRVPARPAHDQRHAERAGHARPDRRDAARPPRRASVPPRLRHARARRGLPGGDRAPGLSRCRRAIERGGPPSARSGRRWRHILSPSVPCHNDLLADNYIEQDDRLRLVDWEYSGNGDPAFELGNTCRELDYDDARLRELCQAYFGRGAGVSRRARAAPHDRLRRRLDALGGHPDGDLPDRVRLRRLRRRAVGARRRRPWTPREFPRWIDAVGRPAHGAIVRETRGRARP